MNAFCKIALCSITLLLSSLGNNAWAATAAGCSTLTKTTWTGETNNGLGVSLTIDNVGAPQEFSISGSLNNVNLAITSGCWEESSGDIIMVQAFVDDDNKLILSQFNDASNPTTMTISTGSPSMINGNKVTSLTLTKKE